MVTVADAFDTSQPVWLQHRATAIAAESNRLTIAILFLVLLVFFCHIDDPVQHGRDCLVLNQSSLSML